jgi:hypothetical protein
MASSYEKLFGSKNSQKHLLQLENGGHPEF